MLDLDNYGSTVERDNAERALQEENQKRAAASIEVARKYKAQFSSPSANNDANIEQMNTEVNDSFNDLRQFQLKGESIEDTALRGRDSGMTNPLLKQAAIRAITASTTLAAEQRGADVDVAEAQARKSQSRTDNMLQTRRNDIRNEARKVAQKEGIPLADAFQIVMMEIQIDGTEAVLPNFHKVRENAIRQMEAENAEAAGDES